MIDRYINPLTDFGFKRLFGSEINKELLISFLNAIFHGEQIIQDVTYVDSEPTGIRTVASCALFEVCCQNDKGEKFIVEMHNVYHDFFKRHTKEINFHISHAYIVGLLNFNFAEGLENAQNWHNEVKLMEVATNEEFYNKLTYIYIEIPKFNKKETELVTMYDKWMYVLKNLSRLMQRPVALQERIFIQLFEQADISKFNNYELKKYEDSMKAYRDIVNAIKTAERKNFEPEEDDDFKEGLAEGRKMATIEIAKNMLNDGMTTEFVAEITELSIDELQRILNS